MTAPTHDATWTGCGCAPCGAPAEAAKVPLVIQWRRLVSEGGETCPRCGTTGLEVQRAVDTLTEVLRPLGIEPILETLALDQATFEASPTESNRIVIGGRSLEDWIGATASASRCCSVCGDNDCRTVEVDGVSFEAVPEDLVIKAALLAAASLLAPEHLTG